MPVLTIKRGIYAGALSLIGLLLIVLGFDLFEMNQGRMATERVKEETRVIAILNEALVELSAERNLIHSALNLPGPADSALVGEIRRYREAGARKFDAATAKVEGNPAFPGGEKFTGILQQTLGILQYYRDETDELLGMPFDRRPADRVSELPLEFTGMINSLSGLDIHLRNAGTSLPAVVSAQESIQTLAWKLFEYGRSATHPSGHRHGQRDALFRR